MSRLQQISQFSLFISNSTLSSSLSNSLACGSHNIIYSLPPPASPCYRSSHLGAGASHRRAPRPPPSRSPRRLAGRHAAGSLPSVRSRGVGGSSELFLWLLVLAGGMRRRRAAGFEAAAASPTEVGGGAGRRGDGSRTRRRRAPQGTRGGGGHGGGRQCRVGDQVGHVPRPWGSSPSVEQLRETAGACPSARALRCRRMATPTDGGAVLRWMRMGGGRERAWTAALRGRVGTGAEGRFGG